MIRQFAILFGLSLVCSAARVMAQAPADDAQLRALQVLRQALLEQQRVKSGAITNPPPPRMPTFEQLEKQYLDGKITARQFQQYVLDYKLERAKPASVLAKTSPTEANPGMSLTPGTAGDTNNPNGGALNRLAEVEARIDQILRDKAEKDKASTNATATTVEPKTKREKLDNLLRQLIAGKITQDEYKERWAKIAAEPD